MGEIVLLPGTSEVPATPDEPEPDLEEICVQQAELIEIWKDFGTELKRRSEYPLPFDLALELYDLLLIDTDI